MQIVRAVAAQDAERAREWAPQVLAELKTPKKPALRRFISGAGAGRSTSR